MNTLGQRIAHYRQQAKLSQRELAARCGWSTQSRIGNYERDVREPNLRDLEKIADVVGVPLNVLIGKPHQETEAPSASSPVPQEFTWAGGFDPWDDKTPLRDDEVEVPLFMEVELSAGDGSTQVTENKGPKLRFAKSTLIKCGVPFDKAACVVVSGTSMEPVIPDKSVVGVDTSINRVKKDGDIYALDHGGLLKVKRAYRLPNKQLRLSSFNQAEYSDETVDQKDIRILGRVFWWSVLNM